MTANEACRQSIALQDACNGSGVAHTLVDMFKGMADVPTGERNSHPAIKLTIMKLADLAGITIDCDEYSKAYRETQRRMELADIARSLLNAA